MSSDDPCPIWLSTLLYVYIKKVFSRHKPNTHTLNNVPVFPVLFGRDVGIASFRYCDSKSFVRVTTSSWPGTQVSVDLLCDHSHLEICFWNVCLIYCISKQHMLNARRVLVPSFRFGLQTLSQNKYMKQLNCNENNILPLMFACFLSV